MGFYNYKRVMHRDDFCAEAEVYAAEQKAFGWEYEGGCDYDGDGWIVVERLLNKKDAMTAALESRALAAEAGRDEARSAVERLAQAARARNEVDALRDAAAEARCAELERERDDLLGTLNKQIMAVVAERGAARAEATRNAARARELEGAGRAVVDAYDACRNAGSMAGFWTHLDDLAALLDGRALASRVQGSAPSSDPAKEKP